MRKEFNKLVETLKRLDLYQIGDEVDMDLKVLDDKIIEVEKRMKCIDKCADEINVAIGKYTERVDNNEVFVMSVNDHDSIMRGSHDIGIALDLNDNEVIENNWYELFVEPNKEVSSGGIPYKVCNHCAIKEEENVMTKVNDSWLCCDCYNEIKNDDIPTYQCRNQHTFDKVKEVIQILKTLDNGDCVDGETMDYIINKLGFEDYLLRSLIMKSTIENVEDLLNEKIEIKS
jgi:hypothetical protein